MSTSNNFYKEDLYKLHDIVQNTQIVFPKEAIIWVLRDFFSKSSYYHYQTDEWGFTNNLNHTNLPLGGDLPSGFGSHPELSLTEKLATRIFIGEQYHQDKIFYPSILVRNTGSKYNQISFNRNKGTIQYNDIIYDDGYGNTALISRPAYFVTAGAWDSTFSIDVITRSLRSRDDIVQLISICLTEIYFDLLQDIGVVIKPINISSPTEIDDRNDKLFKQTINLDIRSEWRREIPINTLIDAIRFSIEFVNLSNPDAIVAQNLTISTEILLENVINT